MLRDCVEAGSSVSVFDSVFTNGDPIQNFPVNISV